MIKGLSIESPFLFFRPTLIDKDDTRENERRRRDLLPGQTVHASNDAHHRGDDRLQIAVKTDDSRTQRLLPYRYEEIGNDANHKR